MSNATNPAAASPSPAQSSAANGERADRKVVRGQVTSNKMAKTVVIEVRRKVKHPLYEKYLSRRTKLYAHDENNEAKIGDIVEIMQTRPLSKLKRWRLIRIVQRAVN